MLGGKLFIVEWYLGFTPIVIIINIIHLVFNQVYLEYIIFSLGRTSRLCYHSKKGKLYKNDNIYIYRKIKNKKI